MKKIAVLLFATVISLAGESIKIKAADCRKDWKPIVFSFRVPEYDKWKDCAFLLVTLGAGSNVGGKAYFDDFQFFVSK